MARLFRRRAFRVGAVAVAALIVAEAAALILRPGGAIDPAAVSEHLYFSASQLRRAADFRGGQRWLDLGGIAVEALVLAALACWRPAWIRRALDVAGRRPLLGAAAVGVAIALILAVAALPLGIAANRRAHAVGLSTQGVWPWLADQGRAAAAGAVLAALGGFIAMVLLRRLGRRFWLGGTALAILGAVVFVWLAPVLLAPLFNRFERLPDGRVRSEVLALSRRAGVTVGQVYRVDASRRSTALNAYVDGLGPTKRVVLYDTAIEALKPAELRSVVAHELGHVKDRDILRGILFVVIVAPLGMLFAQLLTEAICRSRGDDLRSPAALPALALSLALAVFALGIPGNQLSRAIEAKADTFALRLTGDPGEFIALQRRLALSNLAAPSPSPLLQALFATHPSTMQRIGAAVAFRGSIR